MGATRSCKGMVLFGVIVKRDVCVIFQGLVHTCLGSGINEFVLARQTITYISHHRADTEDLPDNDDSRTDPAFRRGATGLKVAISATEVIISAVIGETLDLLFAARHVRGYK